VDQLGRNVYVHINVFRRQLEEELEMVRGEMLSCDAQLKEVR
jgi:hypothetical protein